MLRWINSSTLKHWINNEDKWGKLEVASIEDKMRETHLR